MNMKKTIIIGGGIAGLTAGIYLQKAGIQTEIYEKNKVPGGMCMGWRREGYFIDNCIHWLTGTREGSALNELWKNIGALGEGVKLYQKDQFFSVELNGEKLTFWRDLERTRKEMLKLSPEDEEEINKLIHHIKLAESMVIPVEKPFDMMNPLDYIKMGLSMADMGKVMKEYAMDLPTLAKRFRHPLIGMALQEYMPPGYQAYSLLVSYATVTSGNGDFPAGGSQAMAFRIVQRYKELGGILHTGTPVQQIIVQKKKAAGILLENGTRVAAEYVICALDTSYTFSKLLDRKYMPKQLARLYEERSLYPVVSGFQIAFGVEGRFKELHGNQMFTCRPIQVGTKQANEMSVNCYDFEPEFAPEGKVVVQSHFIQTQEDYRYWVELYETKEAYHRIKAETGEEARKRLVERYPFLEGKVKVIDIWTPVTYRNYCNAYQGAYMGFIITKNAKSQIISGKIKGLPNVFLASQWQMSPGGLPSAAAMGKFAAMRIIRK